MLLLLPTLLLMSACGSQPIDTYADRTPLFEPTEFFSGFLTAHGVVKNWRGDVIRYFNADINACWQGDTGTLDEHFEFDDGERQQRVWTLIPSGAQSYRATAGDVVGNGEARWSGNAFFLNYVLNIPLDDDSIDVRIDDRMYRVSDNVVINESAMEKYGLGVGDIVLTIVRHPEVVIECPNL